MSNSNGNGYTSQFEEFFDDSETNHSMNQHGSEQWPGEPSSLMESLDMDHSRHLSPSLQPHEAWRHGPNSQHNRHAPSSLDGAMNIGSTHQSEEIGNENLRAALLRDPLNSYSSISSSQSNPSSSSTSQPTSNGLVSEALAPSSGSTNVNSRSTAQDAAKPGPSNSQTKSNSLQSGPSKASAANPTKPAAPPRSRRAPPTSVDILNKFKSGAPKSDLEANVNELLSKLDVSIPTSSEDSTPLKQTGPSERKDLIDKFIKIANDKNGGEFFLKTLIDDSRGRALFSSWISDATPGRDESEGKSKWVGTLIPLLRLLHTLPITLEHLKDDKASLGKKMKTFNRRTTVSEPAKKLVDMVMSKWQRVVTGIEKRPAEGEGVPTKAPKLVKTSSPEAVPSRKSSPPTAESKPAVGSAKVTSKTPSTGASKSVSKPTSKPASKSTSSSASKPAVQSDSSFFGASNPSTYSSRPVASLPAKRGTISSSPGNATTSTSKRITSDPKKRSRSALDEMLFSTPAKPVPKEIPAPLIVKEVQAGKKAVRWKEDSELEQVKIFTSEPDHEEGMHAGADENMKLSETSEGDMLEEAKGEMIEEQDWFEAPDVEIEDDPNPPRAEGSLEIRVQEERESKSSAVVYQSKGEIPETPASPEPQALVLIQDEKLSPPKEIPLPDEIRPFVSLFGANANGNLAAVQQNSDFSNSNQTFNSNYPHALNPAASATSSSSFPGTAVGGNFSLDNLGINSDALSSLAASFLGQNQQPQQLQQSYPPQQAQGNYPAQWATPQALQPVNYWQQQQQPQQEPQNQGATAPHIQPQGFRQNGRICRFFRTARGCHKQNCEFAHTLR